MSNLEVINTENLELLAKDFIEIQRSLPLDMRLNPDLETVSQDLFAPLFYESARVLGGVVVHFEAQYVAPIETVESSNPITALTYGETSGLGKLVDVVPYFDFTPPTRKAGITDDEISLWPGLIFETDDEYQELVNPESLGIAQLFPYCAVPIGNNISRFEYNPFGRLDLGQPY